MMSRAVVVLPTYNEANNIPILIPRIFQQASKITTHELHVLVVDDKSPDGTADIVRKYQAEFSHLHLVEGEKKGLGEAYKRGMDYAVSKLSADLIFEMDADLQHDPELLPLFVHAANYNFNLVIGSRFAPGGGTPSFSLYRRFLSRLGNWMVRFLGGLPRIHDCTSGYRCIRADLFRKCDLSFLSTRGYSFQSSLLCELLRNGARVLEIPIIFGERQYGESKLSLRDQVEFLINVWRIRFRQSHEFIKFALVGASGVLVNLGVYMTLTRMFGFAIELASPAAIEASILWNFLQNNLWTFRHRKAENTWVQRLWRFHAVAGVAGVANYAVFLLLVRALGVWDVLAILVGIGVGVLINYSLNSLWTWKERGVKT